MKSLKKEKYYNNNYEKFANKLEYHNLIRGEYYNISYVNYLGKKETKLGNCDYYFKIEPFSYWDKVEKCAIRISKDLEILDLKCSCSDFKNNKSCNHLAAVFKNYSDVLFYEPIDINKLSLDLLNKYSNNNIKNIKKELFLEVSLNPAYNSYYDNYQFEIKIKIGEGKMYSYGAHQSAFIRCYETQSGSCKFGKDFTYEYDKYYFNDNNKAIIEYINNSFPCISTRLYEGSSIKKLLDKLLEYNINFSINGIKINHLINSFPFNTEIVSQDDNYLKIKFNIDNYISLDRNNEYILYDTELYKLSIKDRLLLQDLEDNDLQELIISKDNLDLLSKSILPIIKEKTNIEDKLKDKISIINKPHTKLYFDLNRNNIEVSIKLLYQDEIDYFEETNNILRDIDYENEIINDLYKLGFIINKKKIILEDLEKIIELRENGLEELNKKYQVFTSDKVNNLSVIKNTSIKSTFSIGQDNILNYKFDLNGINPDELVNIFKSIKEKKKYYRLKNGNILSLEDQKLQELNNLQDELEFSDEEIIKGKGSILKYRAIYLDSIKKDKYSIIETDNLFNNFIDNFYKYKDSDLTLSKKDLSILRDYQLVGVKWLYNLDKTGFGGILADEMGLGKTLQTIYYIKQILKEDPKAKFLIVVPTSLVYNWKYEFEKYSNDIDVSLVVGLKDKRKKILDNTSNVYLTTYGILREDEDLYENRLFHAVIIDEAQNIKNPMAGITKAVKDIKSNTKFALTGTPIENSTIELWSIFDFIMPGYLATNKKFSSKYKINDFNEKTDNLISNLSNQIKPFILRRLKNDVIKELPEKLENNIYIELSDEQKKIYVAELDKVKKELDKIMKEEGVNKAKFLILPLLTKLRQICIDPRIVYSNYDKESNKIDRFVNIIEESVKNNHKVLVFTSFKDALNIAKKELEKMNIDSYVLDGSTPSKTRIERVNSFNNDKDSPKVFLIMLKAGGTGLNLTGADVVIHLDLWWNPQAENQATDRAHRIGQKNIVNVVRLVTKGTIEEKVLELQEKKKELSNKILDSDNKDQNILSTLTEKDIKNLLSYENK